MNEKLPEGIDSWCQMCGAAPGEPCTVVSGNPVEGLNPGDLRPDLHFYRGGLAEKPAVLVPDEPPFDSGAGVR